MSFCVLATTSAQTTVADTTKMANPTTSVVDAAPQKAPAQKEELTPDERLQQLQKRKTSLSEEKNRLQKKIEETRRHIDTIKTFLPRKLDSEVKRLRQEVWNTKDSLTAAQEKYTNISKLHKEAESKHSSLKVYAEIRTKNLYNTKFLPMLNRGFSKLCEKEITELQNSCRDCVTKSDKAKVDTLLNNLKIYNEGVKLLKSPFDNTAISKLRYKTYALVYYYNQRSAKNNLSEEQFKEMDDLDISLSRYQNGTIELGKIIDAVNANAEVKKLREEKNRDECIKKIESIVLCNDGNKATYERYFNRLPYLQKMINDYLEEIRKDPFTTTKTEEEIKKLCSAK